MHNAYISAHQCESPAAQHRQAHEATATVTVTVYRSGFDFTHIGTNAGALIPGLCPATAGTRRRMEAQSYCAEGTYVVQALYHQSRYMYRQTPAVWTGYLTTRFNHSYLTTRFDHPYLTTRFNHPYLTTRFKHSRFDHPYLTNRFDYSFIFDDHGPVETLRLRVCLCN